jgi:hypothetical protein
MAIHFSDYYDTHRLLGSYPAALDTVEVPASNGCKTKPLWVVRLLRSLRPLSPHMAKSVEGAAPLRFRPMYAVANMGTRPVPNGLWSRSDSLAKRLRSGRDT